MLVRRPGKYGRVTRFTTQPSEALANRPDVVVELLGGADEPADLMRAALRHGGVEAITLAVTGREVRIGPVAGGIEPILLGEELKDIGAAVGTTLVRALGGDVRAAGGELLVTLR